MRLKEDKGFPDTVKDAEWNNAVKNIERSTGFSVERLDNSGEGWFKNQRFGATVTTEMLGNKLFVSLTARDRVIFDDLTFHNVSGDVYSLITAILKEISNSLIRYVKEFSNMFKTDADIAYMFSIDGAKSVNGILKNMRDDIISDVGRV